jgi:hypothetical protein
MPPRHPMYNCRTSIGGAIHVVATLAPLLLHECGEGPREGVRVTFVSVQR